MRPQPRGRPRHVAPPPVPASRIARRGRRDHLVLLALVVLVPLAGATLLSLRNDGTTPLGATWRTDAAAPEVESGDEPGGRRHAVASPESGPDEAETTTTTTTTAPRATLAPLAQEPGMAPVITRVETDDPVVFLTIDDGLTRDPAGLAEFERLGMPASLFLINEPIERDADFFRSMPGTLVESHTQTHSDLTGLPEEAQRQEICGNADLIERTYRRRPVLFRPPGGNYNDATKRAAAACGMAAVVLWQENVNWDVVGFREEQRFRPGDIILMHFRPQFVQELNVIKRRVEEAGLRFALLEDYLAPDTVPADLER